MISNAPTASLIKRLRSLLSSGATIRDRSRSTLAILLGVGLLASACSTTPTQSEDAADSDSISEESPANLPLADESVPFEVRVSQQALGQSVAMTLFAPPLATQVQISTDPSFVNAPWRDIGDIEVPVVSTGIQELFARYRDGSQSVVGDTDVSAFDISGPLTPMIGSDIDASLIRVTRVASDVLQVNFEVGEVTSTNEGPAFIEGPNLDPSTWSLDSIAVSVDGEALQLADLGRISEPTGQLDGDFAMHHQLHIRTRRDLGAGAAVVTLPGVDSPVEATINDREWSPAVHTSHLGWATNDIKRAHVSVWTTLSDQIDVGGLEGTVIDADGNAILEVAGQQFVTDDRSEYWRGDLTGGPTTTFTLDGLTQPGQYRFCVNGIGCSHPFEIADEGPWAQVMSTVARGLFHQRSGIDLEQPYTAIERPRAHHPDDGWQPLASEQSLFEDANGRGDGEMFTELVARATDETVDDAWGGHFDAGDWDRRIQHLWMVRRLVDLVDEFDNIAAIELQIPESGDDTPDLLDEGLWSIDAYRRLQLPNGAIRGGIESSEHPLEGTTSWDDPLELYVYAPDAWSSWTYAWTVADAAYVLDQYDPERAAELLDSAVRAMQWAESELAAGRVDLASDEDLDIQRSNAAASLYRATEDEQWDQIFQESSPVTDGAQTFACILSGPCEGAWRYATLPDHLGDPTVRENAANSVINSADRLFLAAETTAYGWTLESIDVNLFFGLGPSNAHGVALMRAYLLTGEQRYRDQAVLNAQFALGANPSGATWITGVGFDNPDRIVGVDQLNGGIPVWPGTPVYGVVQPNELPDWYVDFFLRPSGITPDPLAWPALQGFIDIGTFPGQAEFTIQQSHGEAIWTFGALAGTAQ